MATLPPLAFRPIIKQIRWGGRRLGEVLGKPIGDANDYAESWELVDHGNDQSVCIGPESAEVLGWTLQELVQERGDDLFGLGNNRTQFPLLIKFLDASDRLSVQVHPDDDLAKTFDQSENGKTEAWVILDSAPGAKLYAGLKAGVTEADLRDALATETVESLLHAIEVQAGDCVFIPAGTIHAIGEGVMLAEVQQASDMTFRLYDWGRVGTGGQPRELHIDQSIQATDWSRGPVNPNQPTSLPTGGESLVSCPFFTIDRHTTSGEFHMQSRISARVLIGLDGEGSVRWKDDSLGFGKGQTLLIPCGNELTIHGNVTFLDVGCPA